MTEYECTECGHRQADPFRRCRACGVAGAVLRVTTPPEPNDQAPAPLLASDYARIQTALAILQRARSALANGPRPAHTAADGDGYEWVDEIDWGDPQAVAAGVARNRKP